jgi:pantoate--beta-alanine ligase
MKIVKSRFELREYLSTTQNKSVGFVPTMGALHPGHLSLVNRARNENALVAVSLFVNPLQFNNSSDLENYPRTLSADLELLERNQVDLVWVPEISDIYPETPTLRIEENLLSQVLEGPLRPGHFSGMLLVVLKLLNLVKPQHAYFGEKDFQQQLLVKQMVREFCIDTKVVSCPTVRDSRGLALSSRNMRVSQKDQESLSLVYKTIIQDRPLGEIRQNLEEFGFNVEYLEEQWGRRLIAFHYKGVRFIDNVSLNEIQKQGAWQNDINS